MYNGVVLLLMLLFPFFVFAQASESKIIIYNEAFEDLIFDVTEGSKHNTTFVLENTTEEAQNIEVSIVGDALQSLAGRTRFFTEELDTVYAEQLQQNDKNIVLFCQKNGENVDVQGWCNGSDSVSITLEAKKKVEIPAVIDIATGEIDHNAQFVVTDLNENKGIVGSAEMMYHVPDKNIAQLVLQGFVLQRANNIFDVEQWINAGLRNKYTTKFVVKNSGTEDVNYTYCAIVQSLWIGEDVNFCNDAIIVYNGKQEHDIDITVPRFGKVQIVGQIQYNDQNNYAQEQKSEPIELIVWPVQLVLIILFCICFCVICVLIYKYIINKNMFGRKKKKKKTNNYTGTYVVSSTDNIISIAQSYGVPWKEMAKINEIDPPYILIPGETISVPVNGDDVEANENVPEKPVESVNPVEQKNEVNGEVPMQSSIPEKQKTSQMNQDVNVGAVATVQQVQKQEDQMQKQQNQTVPQNETMPPQSQNADMTQAPKRKVMYAAPENTLAKPASEPTTRAIDIEWMKDDEDVYSEEMQTQKKKLNVRFIVITVIIVIIVGLGSWWIMTWFMGTQQEEGVSVDALIEQQDQNMNTEGNAESSENNEQGESEEGDDEADESDDAEDGDTTINPEDITIQVLNAGAQSGVAGTVTNDFKEKNYQTKSAQNAQNDHSGVVIYYASDKKDGLDAVSALVSEGYGTQTHEESNDVTEKHNADFVVVVGS